MAKRGPKGPHKGQIKKGECRNPTGANGRKREMEALRKAIDAYMAVDIENEGEVKTRTQWLLDMMYNNAMAGSAPHLRELLNRWVGKSKEFKEESLTFRNNLHVYIPDNNR